MTDHSIYSLSPQELQTAALFFDGHSRAQIAERFGITEEAVKKRLYRARKKCPQLRTRRLAGGPGGRVRAASQIGSAERPLNLDTI